MQHLLTLTFRSDSIFGPALPAARIHKVDHKRFCMHSFHLGIDVAKA